MLPWAAKCDIMVPGEAHAAVHGRVFWDRAAGARARSGGWGARLRSTALQAGAGPGREGEGLPLWASLEVLGGLSALIAARTLP